MESTGPHPLDLRIPIAQAPIGGSTCPELAAAVSNAGGLGALALSWSDPTASSHKVLTTRALTDRLFYGNFALAFEPVSLVSALAAGLPCVTFSFGDPSPWVDAVRLAGAFLGIQVGSAAEARRMVGLEPDFLICQGVEAGGHLQSDRALGDVLAEVLDLATSIPVFAAGGLATGKDLRRALDLGAAGGVFGTRFLATHESRAHDALKARLLEAKPDDTAVTDCFDGGWPDTPHRVLVNGTLRAWRAAGEPRDGRPGEGEVVGRYPDGDVALRYAMDHPTHGVTGDVLDMCLYAGTSVGAIHDLPPAGDLVRRLWAEAQGRPESGF
ncbi:MAG: nitronate monooxygenase [Fimbriimonadaceae bacterium]|nr:nitronate monooxygenase [Fimbriimonadaceae bacterium]